MNWDYLSERVRRYNLAPTQSQRDDLLYRIGTHADLFSPAEQALTDRLGCLIPEHRACILEWLLLEDFSLRTDLSLTEQIFSPDRLAILEAEPTEYYELPPANPYATEVLNYV